MKKENTFTLRLSKGQMDFLRDIAERERRTVSAVIRNIIDDKQKDRQSKKVTKINTK